MSNEIANLEEMDVSSYDPKKYIGQNDDEYEKMLQECTQITYGEELFEEGFGTDTLAADNSTANMNFDELAKNAVEISEDVLNEMMYGKNTEDVGQENLLNPQKNVVEKHAELKEFWENNEIDTETFIAVSNSQKNVEEKEDRKKEITQEDIEKAEEVYLKNYENLTSEQQKVVNAGKGILAVLASAGSGKTQTLTTRVANLVRKGVDPKKVCMLTFTVKSAAEMKRRAIAMNPYCRDIVAGTFHSVALRLLRSPEYGNEFHWRILETTAAYKEFAYLFYSNLQYQAYPDLEFMTECMKLSEKDFKFEAKDIRNFIKIYREKSVNDAEIEFMIRKMPKIEDKNLKKEEIEEIKMQYLNSRPQDVVEKDDFILRVLHQTYENFPSYKKVKFMLELDDVVPEACRLLEENPQFQNVFEYVTVDEYQDTSEDQYVFSKLLSNGFGNLLCVGDDKQSIYEWRGAKVDNFKKIVLDASSENIYRLTVNFRSNPAIVHFANWAAKSIKDKLELGEMTAFEKGFYKQAKPGIFGNEEAQAHGIVEMIKKAHASGIPWNEIAVLFRSHKSRYSSSRALQEAFSHNHIPFHIVGASDLRDAPETKIALSFLNLVKYPTDRASWVTVLQFLPRVGEVTALKLANTAYKSSLGNMSWSANDSFSAICNVLASRNASKSEESRNAFETCMKGFENIFAELEAFSLTNFFGVKTEDIVHIIESVGKFLEDPDIAKRGLHLKKDDAKRREIMQENLKFLQNIAAGCAQSENPLDTFLDTFFTDTKESKNEENADGVTLTTVHSAKGLEWNTVFIPDLVDGAFPLPHYGDEKQIERELNEEARLFYVAVSRAKDHIFFSMPVNTYDHKEKTRKCEEASPFIKQMFRAMELDLKSNTNGFPDISFDNYVELPREEKPKNMQRPKQMQSSAMSM